MNAEDRRYFIAAKGVVVRDNGDMLTLFRTETAPTHPLSWDLPGGILEWGEEMSECMARETLEEAGLEIYDSRVYHAISRANKLGEFWTTIYFTARALSDQVVLSYEHNDYRWIRPEAFCDLKASKREQEGVARFVELLKDGKL
jgi:8-oxo-dGTP diphosphatase